ncbi:hypothetical protein N9842_03055 [Porticoccaceae bacterium]|nr:hypothetical protein [Porticoccaceae bacterium]
MSRSKLSKEDRRCDEASSAQYVATITDEAGSAIALTDLTAITLTLYDEYSGTIINSRTDQDVKNANNVVITSGGVLTWSIQPADNAIINTTLRTNSYEFHVALFEYTWDSGSSAGKHELELVVRQLDKVA